MDTNDRLRTIAINGSPRSTTGLRETAEQFEQTAHEFDSAAHEVAAMQLRWAADRIELLEGKLARILREVNS